MCATSDSVVALRSSFEAIGAKTMLDVLNVSTGQNTATKDKFPNRILSESYDAGFLTRLFFKDISLYREAVTKAGAPDPISPAVAALWQQLNEKDTNSDFTRIYPFVRDRLYR